MRAIVTKVRDILPRAQRRQAVWLFGMMIVMALLETVGVISVVPFIMVVANPDVLHGEGWLARTYAASGLGSETRFLFLLGLGMLGVLVIGNGFKALTTWRMLRFTHTTGHVLSVRLLRAYLAQGYDYFLSRHTAELGKNVLSEVNQVVTGIIQPGMTVVARAVVGAFLAGLLVVADPVLALSVTLVLGGAYGLLYATTRLYLRRIGIARFQANRERFRITSEGFGGIKEVKLRGLEEAYTERFAQQSRRFALFQAANATLAQLPRYGLEVIAFGGILLIVLYLLAVHEEVGKALPLIALYAFAGYRMLPVVQEIFAGVARVRFAQPALDLLHTDMMDKGAAAPAPRPADPLPFVDAIRLRNVGYRYPAGDRPVVSGVTLDIPRGFRVGIVGPTGSGKSTLVDVVLGLLQPTEGRVLIDDQPLETAETIRRWQRGIGYVPQHIFLADDTVAANIAFGQPMDAVDPAQVERAARMAQLHAFIVSELPKGYDTPVGERGIRLSGGQRQRLGLARALYARPAVLVLDEATSALDTDTESAVMHAFDGLDRDCTVIMIAHRLTTVQRCDVLIRLEQGRIAATGSYDAVVGVKGVFAG